MSSFPFIQSNFSLLNGWTWSWTSWTHVPSFTALSRMGRRKRELTFFESLLRSRHMTGKFSNIFYNQMRKLWEQFVWGWQMVRDAVSRTHSLVCARLLKSWSLVGQEKWRDHCHSTRVGTTEKRWSCRCPYSTNRVSFCAVTVSYSCIIDSTVPGIKTSEEVFWN